MMIIGASHVLIYFTMEGNTETSTIVLTVLLNLFLIIFYLTIRLRVRVFYVSIDSQRGAVQ